MRNERVGAPFGQEEVIHVDAHLTGVHALGPEDALGGGRERKVGRDHRRGLAAELQRHGTKVRRRRSHDGASDAARAGENHVVERKFRELWASSEVFEERDLLGRQVAREDLDQEAREVAGSIRHLHHGVVAGGEDVDERTERELDREVPGNEHAHHPERLGEDAVPCAGKDELVDRSAL